MSTIEKIMNACDLNEQEATNEVMAANDMLLASDSPPCVA